MSMDKKQKQIALAEAAGWERRRYGDMVVWYGPNANAYPVERGHRDDVLPQYFTDLTAVAALRKVIPEDKQVEFINTLRLLVERLDDLKTVHWFAVIDAPAHVQAEAIGVTLGLWKLDQVEL